MGMHGAKRVPCCVLLCGRVVRRAAQQAAALAGAAVAALAAGHSLLQARLRTRQPAAEAAEKERSSRGPRLQHAWAAPADRRGPRATKLWEDRPATAPPRPRTHQPVRRPQTLQRRATACPPVPLLAVTCGPSCHRPCPCLCPCLTWGMPSSDACRHRQCTHASDHWDKAPSTCSC